MQEEYTQLKLEGQLCFPLYVVSKEIIRLYKPYLDGLNLTYTQYLTMMVLWERKHVNVKELGAVLYLDSGTLTPLLKKMEAKGYITRVRAKEDERNLIVTLTEKGEALKEEAAKIPFELAQVLPYDRTEAKKLYDLLLKALVRLKPEY